ncbi:hypothetical protein AB8A31_16585 [Tardiphaga sp. 804_B3_N1_9]|uniref:hypothetical protein n=1 Tax=Tardiphaga TaxID=1395974 RepID=UPI0015866ACA|nr:hypothetical protein [Tardiphaga robiniae]NUU39634.1 hypothetical protein [Tardiphaga robiniae]
MSIAVTTRIDRDHSAAIHHQNPNPLSAVRLSSFRIALARAREVKRSEIRKGCDWKNGLFLRATASPLLRSPLAGILRTDRFYQRLCICVLTTALQHRCAVCLIVLNSRWGIDARDAQQLVASSCEPKRIGGSGYPCNSMRNPAVIIAAHYDSASTLRTRKTRDDFLTIGR